MSRISSGTAALTLFLAITLSLQRALPFPQVPSVTLKLDYFAKHKDQIDALFIGSSRFYHQIIPPEFDEAVADAAGPRLRSFNCSYDGMWPPESFYLLRKFLELRSKSLKWVLIEAFDFNVKIQDPRQATRRESYWHDWAHTLMALRSVRGSNRTPAEKWRMSWTHLTLWGQQWVSMGRGSEILQQQLDPDHLKAEKTPPWKSQEGYAPGPEGPMTGRVLEEYQRSLAYRSENDPFAPVPPLLSREMERIAGVVRAAGAEPIFVLAPTINPMENWKSIPGGVPLYSFADPRKYPVLFDPAMHYDNFHLNDQGAHFFTRYVAEQFAAAHGGRPVPAPVP